MNRPIQSLSFCLILFAFLSGNVKAQTTQEINDVSYAVGFSKSKSYKSLMSSSNIPLNQANKDLFIKGFSEALRNGGFDPNKLIKPYDIGRFLGHAAYDEVQYDEKEMRKYTDKRYNQAMIIKGLKDGINGTATITEDAANECRNRFRKLIIEKRYENIATSNTAFLEKNAKNPDVVVLPSGLQYKILEKGTGAVPTAKSTVKIRYQMFDINRKCLDGEGGNSIEISVDKIIKGMSEALQMMPTGSVWELYIPNELAYGSRGTGEIKPYSTLIVRLQLNSIIKQ